MHQPPYRHYFIGDSHQPRKVGGSPVPVTCGKISAKTRTGLILASFVNDYSERMIKLHSNQFYFCYFHLSAVLRTNYFRNRKLENQKRGE